MSGGWIDDGFEGHRKRRLVSLAADGLLMRALSHSCKQETDGFVDDRWVDYHVPRRNRRKVLDELVAAVMFEPLPAGESRELVGRRKKGLRSCDVTVTVGPFTLAGYLIHDFLDYNHSRSELAEKRRAQREKKREQRGSVRLWNGELADPLSPGESLHERDSGWGGGSTETTEETAGTHAGENGLTLGEEVGGTVGEVLAILARAPRFQFDPTVAALGIESAIAAHLNKDPIAAAHTAVVWVSDPAFHKTSATGVFLDALRKQEPAREQRATVVAGQHPGREKRPCARCRTGEVKPGYGAFCEQCSEAVAS